MIVRPASAASDDHRKFWLRLGNGEYQAAEYKQIGKGGGRPFKVVKYATDVTKQVLTRMGNEHVPRDDEVQLHPAPRLERFPCAKISEAIEQVKEHGDARGQPRRGR